MRSYGQFCPIAKAAELFCERWTPLILRDLSAGATRFSQLRRGVPLASPTLLSQRLKALEAEGVVERRKSGRGYTYHLTEAGQDFAPLVHALGVWGQRWSRRDLASNETSLTLMMWGLETCIRPDAFGTRRGVVLLTFTDQPAAKRNWWFVNQDGRAELCIDDPGFEVDLYLTTTLDDMIRFYRGDLSLQRALADGQLRADGSPAALRILPRWLKQPPFAAVASRRADARAA